MFVLRRERGSARRGESRGPGVCARCVPCVGQWWVITQRSAEHVPLGGGTVACDRRRSARCRGSMRAALLAWPRRVGCSASALFLGLQSGWSCCWRSFGWREEQVIAQGAICSRVGASGTRVRAPVGLGGRSRPVVRGRVHRSLPGVQLLERSFGWRKRSSLRSSSIRDE